jgi:hypothetical protein
VDAYLKNMVEDTQENSAKCICGSCPSKNECMKENKEWFYCAKDKSKCSIDKKGCICGACPITGKYKLKGAYYCIEGKVE